MNSESRTLPPSIAECRDELRAVLASRVFQQSQQLARLLQYVCSKAVLGEAEQVTEYTIAVDVFGKPEGFRESKDSVVRVEVHRLRKRLTAFYSREGADHKIRIVIPPGSYAPDFQVFLEPGSEAPPLTEPLNGEHHRSNGSAAAAAGEEIVPATPPQVAGVPHRRLFIVLAAIGIVLIAGIAWLVQSQRRADTAANQPVPGVNAEVHILAGYSGSAWADAAGNKWQPDRYFTGGVSRPGPSQLGVVPPDRRLFQTIREGAGTTDLPEDRESFSYDIPMQPGTYELRLYFADPLRESPLLKDSEDGEDVRHFTVNANGRPLLERFDAMADQGYADIDVRAFKDIAPAADGKVHLVFTPSPHRPFVSAIELVPSRAGHANPVRISARGIPHTDADGKTWAPDNYYIQGRLTRHPVPEAVKDFPELFRGERYGHFSYAIPLPPGTYALTLYFAETMFGPLAPSSICRGPGCRVFDVTANGVNLLHDFDIFQEGRAAFRPVVRNFHGLHPNGQGKLLVSFSPSIYYAEVRALEVEDETP